MSFSRIDYNSFRYKSISSSSYLDDESFKGRLERDSREENLCGEVTSPRTKSYKARLSIDKCGWARGRAACASKQRCSCIQPLFFTPGHGRSGRRTCTEGFIVLTEIARVLVNCKALARYLKGGAKEIAFLSFFPHLSIYFCQASNNSRNIRNDTKGEEWRIICHYLRQVDKCSLFVIIRITRKTTDPNIFSDILNFNPNLSNLSNS